MFIRSEPKKREDFYNNIEIVEHFFKQNGGILILYGPSGSGKTQSIHYLSDIYGYSVIYLESPIESGGFTIVDGLNTLFSDDYIYVIDVTTHSKRDLKVAASQTWNKTKIVIIVSDKKMFETCKKLFPDAETVYYYRLKSANVVQILIKYALENKFNVPYSTICKIAEMSCGDVRQAKNILRLVFVTRSTDIVEHVDALTKDLGDYSSALAYIFSGVKHKIKRGIDFIGEYNATRLYIYTGIKNKVFKPYWLDGNVPTPVLVNLFSKLPRKTSLPTKKQLLGKVWIPDVGDCGVTKRLQFYRWYE